MISAGKHIRDPNTGQVLETYAHDDPFADVLQEALNRRLLEFTGARDARGKPIYRRTSSDA
jgi:hypothetical protein